MTNWPQRMLNIAKEVSTWSKDPVTRVGCVIFDPETKHMLSQGFNGLPSGVDETPVERHARTNGEKYFWYAHAEENAIGHAALRGHSLRGAHLVCTDPPCPTCTRLILKAGIEHVYFAQDSKLYHRENNQDNLKRSFAMLKEAGKSWTVLETF